MIKYSNFYRLKVSVIYKKEKGKYNDITLYLIWQLFLDNRLYWDE